jgi:protein-S-isoprenylcysteine O-methyltransferase
MAGPMTIEAGMIHPMWLALFYGASEIAITMGMRSKQPSVATDRGSLRLIWRVTGVSMIAAFLSAAYLRGAYFGGSAVLYWIGFATFVFGLGLRWYAIRYLGKSFTVDVAVVNNQSVIDTGPYRFIRHPSYTGSILGFLGLGLCFANAVTLLVIVVPTTAVFLYRISIEEAALQAGLGEAYRQYMGRTKRLVPLIY